MDPACIALKISLLIFFVVLATGIFCSSSSFFFFIFIFFLLSFFDLLLLVRRTFLMLHYFQVNSLKQCSITFLPDFEFFELLLNDIQIDYFQLLPVHCSKLSFDSGKDYSFNTYFNMTITRVQSKNLIKICIFWNTGSILSFTNNFPPVEWLYAA